MAALLPSDQEKREIGGGRWYLSRREIEENSPSRSNGIDLKKEAYLRKSYCTFLQDLGMRLKVPQVTIATAIIFCHRFFLRQSHAKNDRRTVATVCMFLAGKVEETPRPLKDVILVSYEIIHKKDPAAIQRIKQKEVYEQQKELILVAERLVLATLGFDFNVHHPYKPLVEAIKKFKVAQNALAQVAWNFVNDGLRTSLCLQFKPHHIAAGAIFLATKFLKVKLPSDGDKVWWQEFDVTPRQLEEVSNQMLELYEQNRVPAASQASEAEGSGGGGGGVWPQTKVKEENATSNSNMGVPRSSNEYGSVENEDAEVATHDNMSRISGEKYDDDKDGIKKLDKDKLKAAIEKRKKSRSGSGEVANNRKISNNNNVMDEDDIIERELEDGIELVGENEKIKESSSHDNNNNVEEGELEVFDSVESSSPKSSINRKRKADNNNSSPFGYNNNQELSEVRNRLNRHGFSERDHKRHMQENHV